ncbi:MAG: flagellar hook-length control protein FliK, partial [Vampirovibrionia bacterium]
NIINSLFSKSNDPALAGIKVNTPFTVTNNTINTNSLTNVTNTAQTNKPDSIVNQVMDTIRNNFNKDQITVSLRPYDLGNVNINVSLQKGALIAHMVTETTKAADSLNNGINSLKQVLAEAGLNVDKIIVTPADQAGSANNNNNNENQHSNKEQNYNQSNPNQNQQSNSRGANASNNNNSQLKNNQNSNDGGINHNNSTENGVENTPTTERNYINSEKGLVNYRV